MTTDTFVFASNQGLPDEADPARIPDDTISIVYPDDAGDLQHIEIDTTDAGNPMGDLNHFRVEQGESAGRPALVLHFLAREAPPGGVVGSYALPVVNIRNNYYAADPFFLGSDVFGTELVWLPDGQPNPSVPAGAWAFYRLRTSDSGATRYQVQRCWWAPRFGSGQ
jgi:hypothetical protein